MEKHDRKLEDSIEMHSEQSKSFLDFVLILEEEKMEIMKEKKEIEEINVEFDKKLKLIMDEQEKKLKDVLVEDERQQLKCEQKINELEMEKEEMLKKIKCKRILKREIVEEAIKTAMIEFKITLAKGNYSKALELLKMAADVENGEVMWILGKMFHSGAFTISTNEDKAK